MTDAPGEREPVRRFSFLEDQEYKRRKEEAAAAAAAKNIYQPGTRDYLFFGYFCLNLVFVGCPLLNSAGILKVWKNSETFRSECSDLADVSKWCKEQADSARIALLLYQSALAATSMMGGVLVDLFSASTCLLLAHVTFASGLHFFSQPETRKIFLGALLQGIGGELLLNSVLPLCGLFARRQNVMLLVLTFCNDVSILIYPLLLSVAPDSPLSTVHAEFYSELHGWLIYLVIGAAILGTFLLPVDDQGNLIALTKAAVLESHNRYPPGTLGSAVQQRLSSDGRMNREGGRRSLVAASKAAHDGTEDDADIDDPTALLLPIGDFQENNQKEKSRQPRSLWELRFSQQLGTPQFLISMYLFTACVLRNSFYFNNHQQLLESVGDDGRLTEAFMWILGLGCLFGPITWHINDTQPQLFNLTLVCVVTLVVNVLAAFNQLQVQWVTMVLFVLARSSTTSTMLTYSAGCFGFKHFAGIVTLIGLTGAFGNFLNLIIDDVTENRLQGDFRYANYLMIGLGITAFYFAYLQYRHPTIQGVPPKESKGDDTEGLRQAVEAVHQGHIIGPTVQQTFSAEVADAPEYPALFVLPSEHPELSAPTPEYPALFAPTPEYPERFAPTPEYPELLSEHPELFAPQSAESVEACDSSPTRSLPIEPPFDLVSALGELQSAPYRNVAMAPEKESEEWVDEEVYEMKGA